MLALTSSGGIGLASMSCAWLRSGKGRRSRSLRAGAELRKLKVVDPIATLQRRSHGLSIEQSIVKERGITTVVICPADVPRESDFHFTCTARLDVGSYPVSVIKNADGGVSYSSNAPLHVLDSRTVELAIQRAISNQRHLAATVSCHGFCP